MAQCVFFSVERPVDIEWYRYVSQLVFFFLRKLETLIALICWDHSKKTARCSEYNSQPTFSCLIELHHYTCRGVTFVHWIWQTCQILVRHRHVFDRRTTWVKAKVKFALEQVMKTQRGSRGIALVWSTPCIYTFIHSFIHSLLFSLIGRVDMNQSPVMWPV